VAGQGETMTAPTRTVHGPAPTGDCGPVAVHAPDGHRPYSPPLKAEVRGTFPGPQEATVNETPAPPAPDPEPDDDGDAE
jgi:hypothetical protein